MPWGFYRGRGWREERGATVTRLERGRLVPSERDEGIGRGAFAGERTHDRALGLGGGGERRREEIGGAPS
jgi:hypothetical protein